MFLGMVDCSGVGLNGVHDWSMYKIEMLAWRFPGLAGSCVCFHTHTMTQYRDRLNKHSKLPFFPFVCFHRVFLSIRIAVSRMDSIRGDPNLSAWESGRNVEHRRLW